MLIKNQIPFFISLLITSYLSAHDLPEEPCCPRESQTSRVNIKHLEYQGIGYDRGYTSLDLFLSHPKPFHDSFYFFFDARAHVFNNGKPAVNTGIGCRYVFDSLVDAIGINTYYDYRKTKRKNYNQYGVGIEYLKTNWEFRANGYFPFGSRVSKLFDLQFSHFSGHSVYVSRKHEFSMLGCDGEIGWHFIQWGKVDFYLGAGPYWFQGHYGKAATGGKARLKARFSDYVSLEVGDSYDAVFKNRFHGEIAISIPFGPRPKPKSECKASCFDQNIFQRWVHDSPYRNEMIVVDTKRKTSVAIDPGNGLPYFFWFVNNTSSSNGTFESAYPTIAQAETASAASDIIYVFPGDNTFTGMDTGFVFKDRQRLLGSGTEQEILTQFGSVAIPPQTTTMPLLSNQSLVFTDVITLANQNTISGLVISCANQNGLTMNGITQSNPALSISDLTVVNNRILHGAPGSMTTAILLNNVGGNVLIAGNSFAFGGSSGETGINITNLNVDTANYLINNNTIIAFAPIVITQTNCPSIQTTLSENYINGLGAAIAVTISDGSLLPGSSITVQENTINSLGDNIDLVLGSGMGGTFANADISVANNTMTSTGSCLFAQFIGDSQSTINASNNGMVAGNGSGVFAINMADNAVNTANVFNNNLKIAVNSGALVQTNNNAIFTGTFRQNNFTNDIAPNLSFFPTGPSSMNLVVSDNRFTGGFGGVNVSTNMNAAITAEIVNNTILNQSDSGINISLAATSTGQFKVHNNTITDAVNSAANIGNGGTLCLSFQNNVASPIQLYPSGGAPAQGAIQLSNAGTFNLEPLTGNVGIIDMTGVFINVPQGTCH